MPRLHLNICLSDIPRDLIRKASNGKSYINLNVTELRETDDRGTTTPSPSLTRPTAGRTTRTRCTSGAGN